MAHIRAFKAIRPRKDKVAEIAALPYDVYSREEAAAEVHKNPNSFLAIDRAESMLDSSADMYAQEVYQKADAMLKERIAKGDFIQDEVPMYYIYALTMNGRTQHGFAACASIDDYLNQIIKKHENTRADKELDRIHHVDICSMQTGPIFLAYRQTQVLAEIMKEQIQKKPEYDFVSEDGIGHTVWCVDQEAVCRQISEAFDQMQSIYIADGHHRCASAVKVGLQRREKYPNYTGEEEFNFFLSVLFPEDELGIRDYNRVLKDLGNWDEICSGREEFFLRIAEKFRVKEIPLKEGELPGKPSKKGQMLFLLNHKWYNLEAKEECFSQDPVENLDVSILQKYILTTLFGIEDPKTDKRIDFVGGIRGLQELERRCLLDCKAAFAMYPTDIHELFAVADAGLLMPPKSTWFEPKLRSGIFLHQIER